jgi:phosphohistidine swiveling domain-containing protein
MTKEETAHLEAALRKLETYPFYHDLTKKKNKRELRENIEAYAPELGIDPSDSERLLEYISQNETKAELERSGFDINQNPELTQEMIENIDYVKEIIEACQEERRQDLMREGFPLCGDIIIIKKCLPQMADIAKATDSEGVADVFCTGLPGLSDVIIKHGIDDIAEIVKASRPEDIQEIFIEGFPLCKKIIHSFGTRATADAAKRFKDRHVKLLFMYGLPACREYLIKTCANDQTALARVAEDLSDISQHCDAAQVNALFGSGLTPNKELITAYGTSPFAKIAKAARPKNIKDIFQSGIPLCKELIESEQDLVSLGSALAKITEKSRPADTKTILSDGIKTCMQHIKQAKISNPDIFQQTGNDLVIIANSCNPDEVASTFKLGITACAQIINRHGTRDLAKIAKAANPAHVPEIFKRFIPQNKTTIERYGLKRIAEAAEASKKDRIRALFAYGVPILQKAVDENVMTWEQAMDYLNEHAKDDSFYRQIRCIGSLINKGMIERYEDIQNIYEILANPKISDYENLIYFLEALTVDPKKMKIPLKNLIAAVMTTNLAASKGYIEVYIPGIKEAYEHLIQVRGLDSETRFLLRKLGSLLPLGGNQELIEKVRKEAIELQDESDGELEFIREKIHNHAGREDVEFIQEYINFLDSGNPEKVLEMFRQQALPVPDTLAHKKLLKTKKTAESLLIHLKQLWQIDSNATTQRIETVKKIAKQEGFSSAEWNSFLKNIDTVIENLEKGNFTKIAKSIGHARRDLNKAKAKTFGELAKELFYLDLMLENIENLAYMEVNKAYKSGEQGLPPIHTIEQLEETLEYMDQLLNSAIYSNLGTFATWLKNDQGQYVDRNGKTVNVTGRVETQSSAETNFQQALITIKKYRYYKNKDVPESSLISIIEAMNLIQRGVELYSEAVISELRSMLSTKMPQMKGKEAQIEAMVSPFYKTGAVYVLGELAGHILNFLTGGEGVIVCNGKAAGKVRIVETAEDVKKFKTGEIFIARNPTPELNSAMMAARAIITQEGGSTSHAAMIAREHKIPCIVARPRVMSDFSTGQHIMVDADNGVIKMISEQEAAEANERQSVPTLVAFSEMQTLSFKGLFPFETLSDLEKLREKKYILPLDASSEFDQVGGKAINLFKLKHYCARGMISGAVVPDGFTITVNAYVRTLINNYPLLCEELSDMTKMSEDEIEKIFLKIEIPDNVQRQILAEYKRIGGGYVSVRSSATTEDTAQSTFAGLHSTFIFQKNTKILLEAVKRCWASLYSHRAIMHRNLLGIEEQKARMAVVVQKMVNADFSGVIYTEITENFRYVTVEGGQRTERNVKKSKDRIKIEIVKGHGEDLVSGKKTPSIYIIDKKSNIRYLISGRMEKDIEEVMQTIVNAALSIEQLYGSAQDIEFCIKKGKLYLLQTRNIAVAEEVAAAAGNQNLG